MDKEIKAKWLTALRSGDYAQGLSMLSCQGVYCCLGVLADTQGWLDEPDHDGVRWAGDDYCELPTEALERADFDRLTEANLMRMNDQQGKSFAEIADWIEANL